MNKLEWTALQAGNGHPLAPAAGDARIDGAIAVGNLPDALHHNAEWIERSRICLRALREEGATPTHAFVRPAGKDAMALDFCVDGDTARCAELTRLLQLALAREFSRVIPSLLWIGVKPMHAGEEPADPDGEAHRHAELAATAVRLAASSCAGDWRLAATACYLVAYSEARRVSEATCPSNQNLLVNAHDATIWRLRLHGCSDGRYLAETLSLMLLTFHEAAFDLHAEFPRERAELQLHQLRRFLATLAEFEHLHNDTSTRKT